MRPYAAGRGTLSFSSGAAPDLVRHAADGKIETWPVIEVSLTPTPASPRAAVYTP